MSDLISRSALKKAIKAALLYGIFAADSSHEAEQINEGFRLIKEVLDEQPAVDAVPVVHARWVKAHGMMPPEYHHRKQCSMCGGWALQDYFGRERMSHYCPNCGAKMRGETDEE